MRSASEGGGSALSYDTIVFPSFRNVDATKVRRTPLRDALMALAAGKSVRVVRAPAIGCAILPVER